MTKYKVWTSRPRYFESRPDAIAYAEKLRLKTGEIVAVTAYESRYKNPHPILRGVEVFDDPAALRYCENHGIYQPWEYRGDILEYYTLYEEGFYRVSVNIRTGEESRTHLPNLGTWHGRKITPPDWLISPNGGTLYQYMCG